MRYILKNFNCTVICRIFLKNIHIKEAKISKGERIELRVSAADKRIFRRAQELSGDRSFSSFIIRVVKQYAEEILANNDRIIASEKDRKIFFDAVFGNSKPNKNLVEAAKRYQSKNT